MCLKAGRVPRTLIGPVINKEAETPTETLVVAGGVLIAFAVFVVVLAWAEMRRAGRSLEKAIAARRQFVLEPQ